MNRRGFLMASGAAAAAGLIVKAEALDFLARQPVSIIKPSSFAYKMKRFEQIAIAPLARVGDAQKWLMTWPRSMMLPHCTEHRDGYVAQKEVTISGYLMSTGGPLGILTDEYAYQCAKKARELIMDVAWEEGWLDEYRAAKSPLPDKFNGVWEIAQPDLGFLTRVQDGVKLRYDAQTRTWRELHGGPIQLLSEPVQIYESPFIRG